LRSTLTLADLYQVYRIAERVWPNVVIAGGSVRDVLLNRPVKDIDIWIDAKDYDNEWTHDNGAPLAELGDVRQVEERYEKSDNRIVLYSDRIFPLICRRMSLTPPVVPVEVIGLKDTSNPTDEFDFGINMAYMDADGFTFRRSFFWTLRLRHCILISCGPVRWKQSV
jgi:hypothetical protein